MDYLVPMLGRFLAIYGHSRHNVARADRGTMDRGYRKRGSYRTPGREGEA
jgi:hypothetical protein